MKTLRAAEVSELHRLLWPTTDDSTCDDLQRWYQQGFKFQALQGFSIGLVQDHGGPCGILAAVQAEMLRLFLFVRRLETLSDNGIELQNLIGRPQDGATRRQLLAEAMASLLAQCADNGRAVCVVVHDSEATYREITVSLLGVADPNPYQELVELLLCEMPSFCSPHGVINFTFSVLRTKGVAAIREEMDDPTNTLTGAFGHCTQELLNLLLTGKAVSNVFDGNVPMGDSGLFLHGVSQRARIGYLTQLEALRYCQVGSYYKSPQFPVWVIGSSSHFSVGFALEAWVSEDSTSRQLFQRVQRVFKQFDPMETGFMEISSLAESLMQLGVESSIFLNERWMTRLVTRLELSNGAGIILWDEYWKVISVLLHTNDFELALSGKYDTNVTESERRPLQRSDSDLARELQAQFDAEDRGGSADSIPANLPVSASDLLAVPLPVVSFDWFYYNGLGSSDSHNKGRRRQLTKCRVTLDTSTEFIGKSVPMENVCTSGGHASNPLEEIMKTKWPNARIDWLISPAPSID